MKKVVGFTLITVISMTLLPMAAAAQSKEEARHCIVRMVPVEVPSTKGKGEVPNVELQDFECFSNFSDAIHKATRGWVNLPSDALPGDLTNEVLRQVPITKATRAAHVVALDYSKSGYSGSTLTWTAVSPCSPGTSFGANGMPSGWNDAVSSTRGYANCNQNVLYEHNNATGASLTCTSDCSSLGVMNDAASSRRWRH